MHKLRKAVCIALLTMSGVASATQYGAQQRHFNFFAYGLGSYNYLQQSNRFISGEYNRGNDIAINGLRLNQIYMSISDTPAEQGLGGYADVVIGEEAILIAPDGWNPHVFNLQNFGVTFPETFLLYRYHSFTLKFGHLLGLPGFESFNFTEDTNFSRSILDGAAQPGSHVGVRGVQQLSNAWSIEAGFGNGWNTIRQPGRIKLVEGGVVYERPDLVKVMLSGNVLDQGLTDSLYSGRTSTRYIIDLFGTYQINKNLQVAWNLDYASQARAELPDMVGRATWKGIDAYLNYQFNDKWRSSLRGEIFDDGDGYRTGVKQVWKELTLTFGYQLCKHLELLAETRRDFSNKSSFVDKGGAGTSHHQQSFALAAFYKTA